MNTLHKNTTKLEKQMNSDWEEYKRLENEIKKCWNCGGNCQGIEACQPKGEYLFDLGIEKQLAWEDGDSNRYNKAVSEIQRIKGI